MITYQIILDNISRHTGFKKNIRSRDKKLGLSFQNNYKKYVMGLIQYPGSIKVWELFNSIFNSLNNKKSMFFR